uniref:Protein regulator of cytokinesis 1b n=1 Tax=Scleropages formosus TaxID=113540 RepID=A0A8C9S6Y8_SCLFO
MRKSEVLAAECVACLNKALCHLKDIWEEIGIPEDQRLQRTHVVKNHIKGLLEMMITEEENLKKRLKSSIETCHKELNAVCKELQIPPFEVSSGLQIIEKDARTRLEAMIKQKSQRMQDLKALTLQDQDLCDVLCTDPYSIAPDVVPSLDQLDNFRHRIASLTAEKERRRAEFVSLKKHIILCMEDLDQLPETSFERDVVLKDGKAFCLSHENITSLKLLLRQLEDQKAENEVQCTAYRKEVQKLWERLQVSQEQRDAFSDHMVMSKKRNLEALKVEVKRLEELKLRNIQEVIEVIRGEVALYWEKCFFSADQRQAFLPYYDENLTDDLLHLHDAEILRLKHHYDEHKELFEGVQKWEGSWKLFLELEKRATDPSRFTNRGGNLLKEAKQRADLHKSLPKLEKKLKAQIEVWEQEQGCEFLVNEQRFLQYVEGRWELHRIEKEREKQERLLKKSKQIEEDLLYGTSVRTPSKKRPPGTTTPGKTLNPTSHCSTLNVNDIFLYVLIFPKHGLAVRTPGRSKPARIGLLERNKENMSPLSGTAVSGGWGAQAGHPQCSLSPSSVASTYSEFAVIFKFIIPVKSFSIFSKAQSGDMWIS